MGGGAKPLMDRKVVGVVLSGVVAMAAVVTSLTTPGCSVVQCSSCNLSNLSSLSNRSNLSNLSYLSYLSIYLSTYRSIYLSICKFENEAILRDFLNFGK